MTEKKRLLLINDLSCVGRCSLSVMLPVVSCSGVEASLLPTALLSTHTGGFGEPVVQELGEKSLDMAAHWQREGVPFHGISLGYLASAEQGERLGTLLETLRGENTRVFLDPAMADNGRYYARLGEEVCAAFRRLAARADVITPNLTEAAFLTGHPVSETPGEAELCELLEGLLALGSGMAVITGVPAGEAVASVAMDGSGALLRCEQKRVAGHFHGTGDLFTAALCALLLRGAALAPALSLSGELVRESLEATRRRGGAARWGVDFEEALPAYAARVKELFAAEE